MPSHGHLDVAGHPFAGGHESAKYWLKKQYSIRRHVRRTVSKAASISAARPRAVSRLAYRVERDQREAFDDGWQLLRAAESVAVGADWAAAESAFGAEPALIETELRLEHCKSALTRNDSPDLPFERSLDSYVAANRLCGVRLCPGKLFGQVCDVQLGRMREALLLFHLVEWTSEIGKGLVEEPFLTSLASSLTSSSLGSSSSLIAQCRPQTVSSGASSITVWSAGKPPSD